MKSLICLILLSSALHAQSSARKDFESLDFRQVCGSYFTLTTNETGTWVRCETPFTHDILSAYSGDYLRKLIPKNAKTPWSLGLIKSKPEAWYEVRTFELVDRNENLIGYRTEFDFPEIRVSYSFMYDSKGRVVSLKMLNF
jgi:hypothetical protein